MVLKLRSADLLATIQSGTLRPGEVRQAYNAIDSAVTLRVHSRLSTILAEQNTPHARTSYSFVRAMQGPAMAMMTRGIAVQMKVRQEETERYVAIRAKAQALLDRLADAVWGPEEYEEVVRTKEVWTPIGKRGQPLTPRERTVTTRTTRTRPRGLNPGSAKQCLAFFNTALNMPVMYEIRKGPEGTTRTPTANDKALAKWAKRNTKGPGIDVRDRTVAPVRLAAPFVSLILTIRDADKTLSVLRTPVDPDGRIRCSYNVAATENWRWSSSKNVYGRGTNIQNITPDLRRMFCADDGYRFVSTDLEQAESYVVAGKVWETTGNRAYLDAILSGDLHTQVCVMAWPELEWSDDPKANRAIADRRYPSLSMSYRDVAKRIGHGSNYRGSAGGISQAVGIEYDIVADFQGRYYGAFPAILEWHEWVRTQLMEHQHLDTPLGQRRWFFGRPQEDSTLREAIACVPQGTVASLLNLIMYRVWSRTLLPPSDPQYLPIELLLQNHDAFAFQTPLSADLPTVISAVNHEFLNAPLIFARAGETLSIIIPGEFVTGYNWGYADPQHKPRDKWVYKDGNPDGLVKWGGSDERVRRQSARTLPGDWLARPA